MQHGDPKGPTTGLVTNIAIAEMREISQLVFSLFKNQYISQGRNFFQDVDDVGLPLLLGRNASHVEQVIADDPAMAEHIHDQAEIARTIIKSFVIYQLTNQLISSGVGCGYYDEAGIEDQHTIYRAMNNYLFDVCFVATSENDGHMHFAKYLLSGFDLDFDSLSGKSRKPSLMPQVLDPALLSLYWKQNRDAIVHWLDQNTQLKVVTPNYSMSIEEIGPQLVEKLDEVVKSA